MDDEASLVDALSQRVATLEDQAKQHALVLRYLLRKIDAGKTVEQLQAEAFTEIVREREEGPKAVAEGIRRRAEESRACLTIL